MKYEYPPLKQDLAAVYTYDIFFDCMNWMFKVSNYFLKSESWKCGLKEDENLHDVALQNSCGYWCPYYKLQLKTDERENQLRNLWSAF